MANKPREILIGGIYQHRRGEKRMVVAITRGPISRYRFIHYRSIPGAKRVVHRTVEGEWVAWCVFAQHIDTDRRVISHDEESRRHHRLSVEDIPRTALGTGLRPKAPQKKDSVRRLLRDSRADS